MAFGYLSVTDCKVIKKLYFVKQGREILPPKTLSPKETETFQRKIGNQHRASPVSLLHSIVIRPGERFLFLYIHLSITISFSPPIRREEERLRRAHSKMLE